MPEEKSINGGELNPAIITQDGEFNKFLMTLPENQRQTPESKYYTYKMWKIAGKPKDFNQAVDMGLYHWNDTDKSYHGNSVIYDEESDVYHFLKPKDHSTVQYELDWYNKGVTTDDTGNQYELAGDSRAEWEDFRRNYYLDSNGDDYVYRRRPTLGISKQSRDSIMTALENGVKAALQNKLSSINQSLQESKANKFDEGGPTEPLYYDNTPIEPAVVKAFKSDEEYNRYYGEQFGKKVAEGMNNAAPYVLEAAMLPFTISGAVETPMLLYQGAKALPQAVKLGKSAFRKGKKYFGKKVLGMVDDMNGHVKEGSHFRIVDKPAIDDAIESGLIRAKTGLHHDAVTYLKNNFSDYLEDIPGWDRMDANDLRGILESKGAFNSGGNALRREAMIQIRNSTNHGGSVHYFKDIPYPNYEITPTNYVIETPENIGSFVAGHGGKEFVGYRGPVGASLLKTNGSVKGASIPTKGSSYWEYSPFWEMWKNNKFGEGGDTTNSEKLIWKRKYKDLPEGFKQAVVKLVEDLNYNSEDVEQLFDSGALRAALDAKYIHAESSRVRNNDSPTSEASSSLEDGMNSSIYNPSKRVLPNMKYAIPYIEDLEVIIPGVGRTTTNALDSLAKYAYEAQIPLEEALGLAAQETAFGATPIGNYKNVPKNATEEERREILEYNRALGNSSYFRNYGSIPAENMVRDFRYNIVEDPISRDTPPLLHAFNYWKDGDYNRGDKNHTSDVIEKGRAVMNTKPVQEWIENSEFAQKVINLFK
jgi:hypothetical protein